MNSYAKLKSGAWGVRIDDHPMLCKGSTVRIKTKGGKERTETIKNVVWRGNGVALCAIYEDRAVR